MDDVLYLRIDVFTSHSRTQMAIDLVLSTKSWKKKKKCVSGTCFSLDRVKRKEKDHLLYSNFLERRPSQQDFKSYKLVTTIFQSF